MSLIKTLMSKRTWFILLTITNLTLLMLHKTSALTTHLEGANQLNRKDSILKIKIKHKLLVNRNSTLRNSDIKKLLLIKTTSLREIALILIGIKPLIMPKLIHTKMIN